MSSVVHVHVHCVKVTFAIMSPNCAKTLAKYIYIYILLYTTYPHVHVYTDTPVAGGAHPIEGQVGQKVCVMHTAPEGCSHECGPACGR